MDYQVFRAIRFVLNVLIGVAGIFLTSFMLYIVRTNRAENLRAYARIAFCNGIVDVMFSVIYLTVMEAAEVSPGLLYLYSAGPLYNAPQFLVTFTSALYLTFLYTSVVLLPLNYYYRYRQFSSAPLTVHQYHVVFAGVFMFVAANCLCVFYTLEPVQPALTATLRANAFFADTPTYLAYDLSLWPSVYSISVAALFVGGSYVVVAALALLIDREIRSRREVASTKTARVDNQIKKVMMVQCVTPFLVLGLPILTLCIFPMFGMQLPLFGSFMGLIVGVIPVCNSLTILIVVSTYRKACLQKLFGEGALDSQSSSAHVGPVTVIARTS